MKQFHLKISIKEEKLSFNLFVLYDVYCFPAINLNLVQFNKS